MADPLMMVVDVGVLVRDLANATARRLEAAKRLPETIARVKRTVGHALKVPGMETIYNGGLEFEG